MLKQLMANKVPPLLREQSLAPLRLEPPFYILISVCWNQERDEAELQTHFQLGNCLYANATIPTTEDSKVCLWLGVS